MEPCAICGDKTELFVNGSPLCVNCSESFEHDRSSIHRRLEYAEQVTLVETQQALATLTEITSELPSAIPHPDGVERVERARRNLHHAQQNYLEASRRLTQFLKQQA